MRIEEIRKRNPQITIDLMQHHEKLKCNYFLLHYGLTVVIRHKRLCKDGKYRGYQGSTEYCGRGLIEDDEIGRAVPFASSEMRDLVEVVKEYT